MVFGRSAARERVTAHGRQRPAWAGYLMVYGARIASVVLGLVLTVASARLLGPQGRGEFAAALAGVVVGVQLLNLGLSASLLLLFSENRSQIRRGLAGLWILALIWLALLMLCGVVLSELVLTERFPFLRWWPLWSLWIPVQLITLYQAAALTAMQDYTAIIVQAISGRVAMVILGLSALLVFDGDVKTFLGFLLLADMLMAAVGAGLVARRAPQSPTGAPTPDFFRAALRLGLRAYPVLFLTYFVIRFDVLLLRGLRGAAETGVYSIAAQFIDLGLILPSTIAALIIPEIMKAPGSAEIVIGRARRVLLYAAGLSLVVLVFGSPAIRLVFGRPYEGAYVPLLILLPGFMALSVQNVVMQHFNAQGYPLFVAGFWAMAAALNLGLNLLLIPRFGMYAAAATSSLSYLLVCGLALIRFRKETDIRWRSLVFGTSLGNAA